MDSFGEISAVVPWLELAHDLGQDLEAPQPGAPPRLFKTHAWHEHCPKGDGVKKGKGGEYSRVCFRLCARRMARG